MSSEEVVPVQHGDLWSIRESLADVALAMQAMAEALSLDSKRKQRFRNFLLGINTALLVMIIIVLGVRINDAERSDEQMKAFIAQVNANTEDSIKRAIDNYVVQTQDGRIEMQDVQDVVCDLDPTLCDVDGNYIGR